MTMTESEICTAELWVQLSVCERDASRSGNLEEEAGAASFERARGGFGAAFALFSPASLIRQHHVSLRSDCHSLSIRHLLASPGWP